MDSENSTEDSEDTDQIPSVLLDRDKFIFSYDSPNEIRNRSPRSKLKIQLDIISGTILQVDQSPSDLKCPLQKIMTRSKGEDGV